MGDRETLLKPPQFVQETLFLDLLEVPGSEVRTGYHLEIDPIDATFRDSSRAPLHSWFPYLEGYSPHFVDRVKKEYLPNAKRIIEPFAGSGTTPIALGQSGVDCAYSEANPAMAFIVQTKLSVLRLCAATREGLANELRRLAKQLDGRVTSAAHAEDLQESYAATFGKSDFFEDEAFDVVLRLRTLNDEIAHTDSLLSDCLTVAVIASLIPASRLKRAGDLRYKTPKELRTEMVPALEAVKSRLLSQAADVASAIELGADVHFACETAVSLKEYLDAGWDGVITSPPYLNGTNYIRNARLELWYLRQLKSKMDLRRLRDRVVTSGINDVDGRTDWRPVTDGVRRVVDEVQAKAYDDRIAKMVGGYFRDMAAILGSLAACTHGGARLCIDIGDSIYAGVHVPTDDLLVEVAESIGFCTVERVHLRKRMSKGGQVVRQQLLIFEKPPNAIAGSNGDNSKPPRSTAPAVSEDTPHWASKWESFKKNLPHQEQPYAMREWGGPAHSMCSYQGKIKPALAHHLLDCFSRPGDVVVDPFSGAGTIPLEACRMGRRGFGIDISRLGYVLTLAKVGRISPEKTEDLMRELKVAISSYQLSAEDHERASQIRFNSAIPDYFHPDTLREVVAARKFFLSKWDTGPDWALLFACTLHLLHGNRPYALSRRSHPVTPFKPTGPFEYRPLMPRLREKVARLIPELVVRSREFGGCGQADCTKTWPAIIPPANVIITSPPFFDSTRFYMTNWMRFWFVGWEREDFDSQTTAFVENRQKQSLNVYRDFFQATRERMMDRGLLVMHLGHSKKCDMATELATRVDPWFTVLDKFTEGVEHCESHGVRDKGTVNRHTYLVLAAR